MESQKETWVKEMSLWEHEAQASVFAAFSEFFLNLFLKLNPQKRREKTMMFAKVCETAKKERKNTRLVRLS